MGFRDHRASGFKPSGFRGSRLVRLQGLIGLALLIGFKVFIIIYIYICANVYLIYIYTHTHIYICIYSVYIMYIIWRSWDFSFVKGLHADFVRFRI